MLLNLKTFLEIIMNKTLIAAALAGIFTAGVAMSANADDQMTDAKKDKCYGVAKAGKNDCKSASGSHSCAGQAKADNDADEWKFVEAGTCEKTGGKLTSTSAK